MQKALSRIWTRVAMYIVSDNNRHSTSATLSQPKKKKKKKEKKKIDKEKASMK